MTILERLVDAAHGADTLVTPGEAADEIERLRAALSAACGYMRNASIDLSTGCTKATAISTIEGGLKLAEAALSATCSRQ